MSNGEKRGSVGQSSEGVKEAGKKPEKLTPAQILERMQSAQNRLEDEEEKRVDGLLEREIECEKSIFDLQTRLEEAKKALGIARESVAGKKKVSEEYTAGFQELEETAQQTEGGIQALRDELYEIRKDPGVLERRKQEVEKKRQETKNTEIKELENKVKEVENKVGELATKMVVFLNEDKEWSFNLDKLHLFDHSEIGGLFNNDVDELNSEISPLVEEQNTLLQKLDAAEQSFLKLGIKKLKKKVDDLAEKVSELNDQKYKIIETAGRKRQEFIKLEAELRAQIFGYLTRLQQLEQKTGRKPEGSKIEVSDDLIKNFYRTRGGYDAPVAGFGIYKSFLKQFGFNADKQVK